MDLGTVTSYRHAVTRADLDLAPGETLLAGGSWLFSEPQPDTTGLVDLAALEWEPWERLPDGGVRIAATCTIAQLLDVPADELGINHALVRDCAEALLLSFKVQHVATVGGNLCLALPAGAMIALTAGLGGEAVVWTPDGGERREPVASFVRGAQNTSLAPGEVLRAIDLPASSLEQPAAVRRMSLAAQGRSSALVVGRRTEHGIVLTVTASTTHPVTLDLPIDADETAVGAALGGVDCWYADHHGPADWKAAMTARLALEVCEELR